MVSPLQASTGNLPAHWPHSAQDALEAFSVADPASLKFHGESLMAIWHAHGKIVCTPLPALDRDLCWACWIHGSMVSLPRFFLQLVESTPGQSTEHRVLWLSIVTVSFPDFHGFLSSHCVMKPKA